MLRISLQTLRARRATLAGAFVAIWLAGTLACATGLLMGAALRPPGAGPAARRPGPPGVGPARRRRRRAARGPPRHGRPRRRGRAPRRRPRPAAAPGGGR